MIAAICRIVVGAVFLVSGALKLRQPSWPVSAKAFGAPRPVALALPWIEIVAGALLVAQIGGRWVPAAALAMLLVFTVVIAAAVARGRTVPCACFGELSARPVDSMTIARNLALCALSLVAIVAH